MMDRSGISKIVLRLFGIGVVCDQSKKINFATADISNCNSFEFDLSGLLGCVKADYGHVLIYWMQVKV